MAFIDSTTSSTVGSRFIIAVATATCQVTTATTAVFCNVTRLCRSVSAWFGFAARWLYECLKPAIPFNFRDFVKAQYRAYKVSSLFQRRIYKEQGFFFS